MVLRPDVVRERLRKLREVIRHLEEIRQEPFDAFTASFRLEWLAERGLQLAAEIVFDVGSHVLTAALNVSPASYEGVTRMLCKHGVLSDDLHERLVGLGGFRNILVHAYLEIDTARVYQFLQENLDVFRDFATEIEGFMNGEDDRKHK